VDGRVLPASASGAGYAAGVLSSCREAPLRDAVVAAGWISRELALLLLPTLPRADIIPGSDAGAFFLGCSCFPLAGIFVLQFT